MYGRVVKDVEATNDSLGDSSTRDELLARSWFKAAFQAETREEFKSRMRNAKSAYDRSGHAYQNRGAGGRAALAKARELFAAFWLEEAFETRRSIIEEAIARAEQSIRALNDEGGSGELANARKDLLFYYLEAERSDIDWTSRADRYGKAVHTGELAIEEFEGLASYDREGLAECLSSTLQFLVWLPFQVLEPSKLPEAKAKARRFKEKLVELSIKNGTPYIRCLAGEAVGSMTFLGLADEEHYSAFKSSEVSVREARLTKDTLLTAWACAQALTYAVWLGGRGVDVGQRQEMLRKGIEFGREAIRNLEVPLEYVLQ